MYVQNPYPGDNHVPWGLTLIGALMEQPSHIPRHVCPHFHSLLRRGLLQSCWVEKHGGWEEGKNKAHGERWEEERKKEGLHLPFPSSHHSPHSRFLSPVLPLPSFFFLWCLLTGASAEERAIFKIADFTVTRSMCLWSM